MRNQNYPGWFLTLTYDQRHVKRLDDGRLSLRFRDVQLFLKTLRKKKYYAKYICVGEYGSETKRPHYHMLLWTDCLPESLEKLWFRGQVHFGSLTQQSAMYTLKYIIQPKQRWEAEGPEPTRAQFSQGLGLSYLSTAVYDYHTNNDAANGEGYDNPILFTIFNGAKVALPRYYKGKIFTKHQLKKVCYENKQRLKAEKADQIRELNAQGIVDVEAYVAGIRAEQARRIISKTKHNQTL